MSVSKEYVTALIQAIRDDHPVVVVWDDDDPDFILSVKIVSSYTNQSEILALKVLK